MAEIPDRIKNMIKAYVMRLKENNIPVKKLILFGSYVRGNHHDFSDIDIALVSDIFEGDRIEDRKKIRKITLSVSSNIEVLPYNPDDFTKEDPFVKEIMETGINIV